MEPTDVLLLVVVVGLTAAVVLRDIAAYERPRTERAERARRRGAAKAAKAAKSPKAPKPAKSPAPRVDSGGAGAVAGAGPVAGGSPGDAHHGAPEAERATVRLPTLAAVGAVSAAGRPVSEAYDPSGQSILGALASVEHDERSIGRRVLSALTLLTLTLLTAALLGAAIYRGLQSVTGK